MVDDDDSRAARKGGDGGPAKPDGQLLRLAALVGAIVVLIGAPAAFFNAFSAFNFLWPARVEAELASCKSNEIVVKLTNRGGHGAMVTRPTFRIRSNRGPEHELKMERIAAADPFAAWDQNVNPDEDADVLHYPAAGPFFSDAELRAGGCHISVSVPVRADRPHDDAQDNCLCGE